MTSVPAGTSDGSTRSESHSNIGCTANKFLSYSRGAQQRQEQLADVELCLLLVYFVV
jgi:hypothetical protein